MQAAVNRLPAQNRVRRADKTHSMPPLATADDAALLGALPIAAAIVARDDDGSLNVLAHNARFRETVELSTCTALNWNDADCLREGPIAGLLQDFFAPIIIHNNAIADNCGFHS